MNRIMQRTSIKKDKVEQYKVIKCLSPLVKNIHLYEQKYHAAVWPEVQKGLVKHGVKLLTIWQPADGGNQFNMYIEWPEDVDLGKALGTGSDYRANPVVDKWEKLMNTYFEAGEWVDMKEVYTLTPTSSTNSQEASYTIVR